MKLFFADTETTGLDPVKNEIFQLAFLLEIEGKVTEEVNITFRPERWEFVSAEALEITGKTKEELKSYPPKQEGFKKLLAVLGRHVDRYDKTDKMIWIGQNPDFDVRFLRNFFREMGDKFFGSWWDPRPADLISLAVASKTRGVFNPVNFKLGTLAAEFGIEFDAHDAMADVRVTREVWHLLAKNITPSKDNAPKSAPKQAELF
jgi:DNA polymerase III epsilon subunit-like protein